MNTSGEQQDRSFSYEELSVLALDAAIEFDQLERGKNFDSNIVTRFTDKLGLRSKDVGDAEALSRLIDPKQVDIFSRAVSTLTDIKVSTVDELAAQIRKYSNVLKQNAIGLDRHDRTAVKNFCLALHRELLAETYDMSQKVATEVL